MSETKSGSQIEDFRENLILSPFLSKSLHPRVQEKGKNWGADLPHPVCYKVQKVPGYIGLKGLLLDSSLNGYHNCPTNQIPTRLFSVYFSLFWRGRICLLNDIGGNTAFEEKAFKLKLFLISLPGLVFLAIWHFRAKVI